MHRAASDRAADGEIRVGEWRVDPQLNEVVRGDVRVHLEPRVMDLLVYLANRAGEVVSKGDLTRDVWDGAYVGDDALVSAVSSLRRALDDDPRRPVVLQTIPKRGYRLIATVARGKASVAVLPLENLSGDADEEYFADGLTDALIAALGAEARELRVISRTSSARYRAADLSLPEIATRLGADFIVEGAVLLQGDAVRITAQLIEARTDDHLWAEVYERRLEDVLGLQSELAGAVGRQIRAALAPAGVGGGPGEPAEDTITSSAAPAGRVVTRAFLDYLRGCYHFKRTTRESLVRALEYFEDARRKDPQSPLPYLGIAEVWGWHTQCGVVPASQAMPEIEQAIARAVELGPDLSVTHTIAGKLAFYGEWDWPKADAALARALEINPSDAHALRVRSLLSTVTGQYEDAERYGREATDLDPLNPTPAAAMAWGLLCAGRLDEAVAGYQRAREIDPDFPLTHLGSWVVLDIQGRFEEAAREAAAFLSQLGRHGIAETLLQESARGGYESAMARAGRLLEAERAVGHVQPTEIARLFLLAGDHPRALDWLETAYREREASCALLVSPDWQRLRPEPRFVELTERIGLPA